MEIRGVARLWRHSSGGQSWREACRMPGARMAYAENGFSDAGANALLGFTIKKNSYGQETKNKTDTARCPRHAEPGGAGGAHPFLYLSPAKRVFAGPAQHGGGTGELPRRRPTRLPLQNDAGPGNALRPAGPGGRPRMVRPPRWRRKMRECHRPEIDFGMRRACLCLAAIAKP
jgi:hypothetical protein